MFVDGPENLPMVSGEIFDDLQANVEDPDVARQYLVDYLQMWDGRFLRLSAAINARSTETAIDAVLSIGTSSRMIGALRLAKLADTIEQHLVVGDVPGAACLLDELHDCGNLTMDKLRRSVLPGSGPGAPNAVPLTQLAPERVGGSADGSSGWITDWPGCERTTTSQP